MTEPSDTPKLTVVTSELDSAVATVTAAEEALDALLRELRSGARAEKVTITATVESAFERLREGRMALAKLRELVVETVTESAKKT